MNYIYRNIMMTLVLALVPFMGISAKKKTVQQSDRQYWCSLAYKMAQPVLENMAKSELQKNMQTEFSPSFDNRNKKEYKKVIDRAWTYLTETAVQPDGKVGYVQPIGERAIPGQTVDANSQANFGVGAMLLTACEYDKYLAIK